MNEENPESLGKVPTNEVEKGVRKIRKFYQQVFSWASISVLLIGIDLFLSGGVSWSKYPVFFWGISLVFQFANIMRIQRLGRIWEEKMVRRPSGQEEARELTPLKGTEENKPVDYSKDLMRDPAEPEKETADLSEYRKLRKPWKDEDLV